MTDHQTYHVVFRHDCVADDLVIAGIFTIRQDAELLRLDLVAQQFRQVARLELSLCAVKEILMKERRGVVEETLKRMEKILEELKAA